MSTETTKVRIWREAEVLDAYGRLVKANKSGARDLLTELGIVCTRKIAVTLIYDIPLDMRADQDFLDDYDLPADLGKNAFIQDPYIP